MEFFKYQSLGNDFILIDGIATPELLSTLPPKKVKSICHRHFGIGADGVLFIYKPTPNKPVQCQILNSDGSTAELCINGIRCVAHYLFTHHHCPTEFILDMGKRSINCQIITHTKSSFHIILNTGKAESYHKQTIMLPNKQSICGDFIQFSNPHFIIFKTVDNEQLHHEGKIISTHNAFPHQTNVAYVSEENTQKNIYAISFYERGVGVTLSCGSGASAVMWALYQRKKITIDSKIILQMSGGIVECSIDKDQNIIQKADAHLVFKGQW
jgi:diaminopimelate epimerase